MRWQVVLLLSLIGIVATAPTAQAKPYRGGPPTGSEPVEVSVGFLLRDLNAVDEQHETYEFEAILTLRWRDPRQRFDPVALGVDELTYQGDYQFSEVFDGWWPQLVLVNESVGRDKEGVMLRITPDGAMTLVTELHAGAETPMQLRRFPFDRQQFHARFEVLGYERDRVVLVPDPGTSGALDGSVNIAGWSLLDLHTSVRAYAPLYRDGGEGDVSQFVVTFAMARRSTHMILVVVAPLTLLVLLTFVVFWMDRESLGERMDITFIGILTVVAYQFIVSDSMPAIAYFTLMTGFLYSTYLVLALTVILNVVVSKLDQKGRHDLGDRVDRTCRWAVPAGFFGANALSAAYFAAFH